MIKITPQQEYKGHNNMKSKTKLLHSLTKNTVG